MQWIKSILIIATFRMVCLYSHSFWTMYTSCYIVYIN